MKKKKYEVTIDGQTYQVLLEELDPGVELERTSAPTKEVPRTVEKKSQETKIPAPMAGTILAIKVKLGEVVKKGDTLCVLEAMKMETPVVAPVDGVVSRIEVSENEGVESNQLLLAI